MKECYYYLHSETKDLIQKSKIVDKDPDYFKSDFVEKVWLVIRQDGRSIWKMILESLALDADIGKVKELAKEYDVCSFADVLKLLDKSKPTQLMKDGLEIYVEKY